MGKWLLVILVILGIGSTVAAEEGLKVRSFVKLPTTEQVIALTFDGHYGQIPLYGAEQILGALAERKIRCTFFLTGEFIEKNPELVRRILADGHEVGNHTYNHAYVMSASETQERLTGELVSTQKVFKEKTGTDMLDLWRAPYGNYNDTTLQWAADAGFTHVRWSVDMLDWVTDRNDRRYLDKVALLGRFEHVLDSPGAAGTIVLCHLVTGRETDSLAEALPEMIDYGLALGYRFVKLSDYIKEGAPSVVRLRKHSPPPAKPKRAS